jgi:hypothetical protein
MNIIVNSINSTNTDNSLNSEWLSTENKNIENSTQEIAQLVQEIENCTKRLAESDKDGVQRYRIEGELEELSQKLGRAYRLRGTLAVFLHWELKRISLLKP